MKMADKPVDRLGKTPNRVRVYIKNYVITGKLYVYEGMRMIDELNQKARDFIAVTDAEIMKADTGELVSRVPFLSINKNMIFLINPVEEG